jgi:hypothetical protein
LWGHKLRARSLKSFEKNWQVPMENTQTKRRFTPEEYETVSERVEVKVEYLDGQIVPKEGLEPLPEWVVDEILSPDFSLST